MIDFSTNSAKFGSVRYSEKWKSHGGVPRSVANMTVVKDQKHLSLSSAFKPNRHKYSGPPEIRFIQGLLI